MEGRAKYQFVNKHKVDDSTLCTADIFCLPTCCGCHRVAVGLGGVRRDDSEIQHCVCHWRWRGKS